MRDYSLPPFDLAEIGQEVKRIGEILNIHCDLAHSPSFREMGFYSMPTISHDIVRIASSFGLPMVATGDLSETGRQLQTLILHLRRLGRDL